MIPATPDAKHLWADWFNFIQEEMEVTPQGTPYAVALPKVRNAAARIALILQMISVACCEKQARDDGVDATSMSRGIAIARWFKGEQQRVYASLGMSKEDQRTLNMIKQIQVAGGKVRLRDWQRQRSMTTEQAEADVSVLFERDLAEWHYESNPKGGQSAKWVKLKDTTPPESPENEGYVCQSYSSKNNNSLSIKSQLEGGRDLLNKTLLTTDTTPRNGHAVAGSVSGRGGEHAA